MPMQTALWGRSVILACCLFHEVTGCSASADATTVASLGPGGCVQGLDGPPGLDFQRVGYGLQGVKALGEHVGPPMLSEREAAFCPAAGNVCECHGHCGQVAKTAV